VAMIKLHPCRTKQIPRSLIYPVGHGLTLLVLSPGKGNSTARFGSIPRWESPNSALGQFLDEDAWRHGLEAWRYSSFPGIEAQGFLGGGDVVGQRLEAHSKVPCESGSKTGH
jgi:hypothetical protein